MNVKCREVEESCLFSIDGPEHQIRRRSKRDGCVMRILLFSPPFLREGSSTPGLLSATIPMDPGQPCKSAHYKAYAYFLDDVVWNIYHRTDSCWMGRHGIKIPWGRDLLARALTSTALRNDFIANGFNERPTSPRVSYTPEAHRECHH